MEKSLSARELKRIESDKRILEATIKVVGEKGYSGSSIREIAREAGVTSGLVIQRFETKENLIIEAWYSTSPVWKSMKLSPDSNAYDVLVRIITDAKRMSVDNIKAFIFIRTIVGGLDLPEGFKKNQIDFFYNSGLYDVLKSAQEAGNIPEGDVAGLYNIFICNSLSLINDYNRLGLKLPKDENFLSLIQYRDLVAEEQRLYKDKAFESVVQSFFNLIYFNVNTYQFRIAKIIDEVGVYARSFSNGQDFLNSACEEFVDEDYKDKIRNFVDLSTVIERIGDMKVIAEDYLGLDRCMYRISFIYVLKKPENSVVLCGVQKLKDNI